MLQPPWPVAPIGASMRRNPWRSYRRIAPVCASRTTGAAGSSVLSRLSDPFWFQAFGAEFYLADSNLMYEWHPYFDVAMTDAERNLAS